MKTKHAILLSVAVLGMAAIPTAHAGFFFGGPRVAVVVQAPPPPAVVVTAPAPYPWPDNTVVVVSQPPAPYAEVIPASPGPAYVWVGGFWNWNNSRWLWVRGHWDVRPYPALRLGTGPLGQLSRAGLPFCRRSLAVRFQPALRAVFASNPETALFRFGLPSWASE